MTFDPTQTGPTIDRLYWLADLGAAPAAGALAQLLDREVAAGPARVLGRGEPGGLHGRFTTAAFHASGDFCGLVAIALAEPVIDRAIERMVSGSPVHDEMADSARREFGNILASHTVSAIADRTGSKILLSLPELVTGESGEELERRLRRRGAALHVETQLVGRDGTLLALLVIVPEPPGA